MLSKSELPQNQAKNNLQATQVLGGSFLMLSVVVELEVIN